MQNDRSGTAAAILADGAGRGTPVEEFVPIWDTARLRLGRASWGRAGLDPFLSYDVPYTGTSSGRLSGDAVEIVLACARPGADLRILELGAGSGVFARLFLDRLRQAAPDVYNRTRYLVTDGSDTILAAQAAAGVLESHADRIERRVLDAGSDWADDTTTCDAVLGTYILDSLRFDLLAVNDRRTWRKVARSVVDDCDSESREPLERALAGGDIAELADWSWMGRRLGLQTRHDPIDRAELAYGETLPTDTGGRTIPFVHCQGALACLDSCRRALRPGGVGVFSDYGHLTPLPAHEFLEFQAFGTSVAVGVNFPQLTAAAAGWDDMRLYANSDDAGKLHTRVLHRVTSQDPALRDLTERLYGAARQRALYEPLERAREMLKKRFYESARAFYGQAMTQEPDNWAIMEEVATGLLMMTREFDAVIDMADQGLVRNPLAPGLWRARGEALAALDRLDEARQMYTRLSELAPRLPSTWRAIAELECSARNHAAALEAVATGLKHDHACEEEDALLQVQSATLAAMAQSEHQALTALANQFRSLDGLPE